MKFSELSQYFDQLEHTASRNQMTEILADLFKKASSDEIGQICYLLQGRVAPLYEPIEFGFADKMVIKALSFAFNKDSQKVLQLFKNAGDLGIVAQQLSRENKTSTKKLSVKEVFEKLFELAKNSGSGSVERKVNILSFLVKTLDPLSNRFVVRIPLAKLRLGFSDMTMLDGLSWMLTGSKKDRKQIETAYNVRPDLGFIAKMVKGLRVDGLTGLRGLKVKPQVGTPILMARAERLSSSKEILEKIGKCGVEYKYDGFRLQVHYSKLKVKSAKLKVNNNLKLFDKEMDRQVRLFSRNLEDVTLMYPDIVEGVVEQIKAKEAIFEGEAIAFNPNTGEYLPFQKTVQRKRKYGIDQKAIDVPLKLIVFELLYVDGESLLEKTYEERRRRLEKIMNDGKTILLADVQIVDSAQKMEQIFDDAISRGLEGIMAKKLTGVYQAGARGWNWIKFKRSYSAKLEDTIDAIIMGYDFGQGKRQEFGIGDFLIGVYDNKNDKFATIAKIGTGLSDEEWRELKVKSEKFRLRPASPDFGLRLDGVDPSADEVGGQVKVNNIPARYDVDKAMECDVWIEPKIVVEILADEITRSPVHTAGRVMKATKSGNGQEVKTPGFALRFPRLKTFRDKQPEDATSLKEIEEMYKRQKN